MSELYVSQVLLEMDGKSITDFKSVEEKEFEVHKVVNLMNTTGHTETKERYGVNLEYVIPKDGPEEDFTKAKGSKIVIDKMNGKRRTYSGVYVLKVGATKYDGDKEATAMIEFSAKTRKG